MIVIATDSTACMTRQEARLLGVICIPMTYTVSGKTYQERYTGDNGDFVSLIAGNKSLQTSQPALGCYDRTFSALRRAGFEVLCLTISSRLSGTYSNACACARSYDRIAVVDTRTTAIGLTFLVREARRFIQSGMSLEETARAIEKMRERVKTVFSVSDMTPLRRSGRLGPVRQSVGTILNIRPLLTCKDGAVMACGTAHGRNEQLRRILEAVPADAQEVAVQYISEKNAAELLAAQLTEKCGRPITIRRLGPVLGIHLGLDIIGAMWCESETSGPPIVQK